MLLLIEQARFLIYLGLFFVILVSILYASDEEDRFARRIQAHLTIGDVPSALQEARMGLGHYPHSSILMTAYIRTLARQGNEKKMLEAWAAYTQSFPEQSLNREMIEEMAWGVLHKASHSSSLVMRQMSLLAAFFSQDARGVNILKEALHDRNYAIRSLAVKLAGHFRDHTLTEEIKRLFKEEAVWTVRQKVLEATGKMKIGALREDLQSLIASQDSLPSEKALAIASLLEMLQRVDRSEIERLSSSSRSGLRQLACKAIAHFESRRDMDCLLVLSKDPHPDVRLASLQAIGHLKSQDSDQKILETARQLLSDPCYQVACSAAWLLTLYSPKEGCRAFGGLLNDSRPEVRILTASALAATGSYGAEFAEKQFLEHGDPFVKLNLALGLIGLRKAVPAAASYIREMLTSHEGPWHLIEIGLFSGITSRRSHCFEDPIAPPEVEDQLIRLDLLNLLAILKVPYAQQAIREYLSERSGEITATAAALLLTEGDESAVDIVKDLLQDPQPRIRLHAALILSLWSREEGAIQALEEGYQTSSWELKARILEGIGRIGSIRSVPFLVQSLKEQSQTLRLIAGMALIQCLNH